MFLLFVCVSQLCPTIPSLFSPDYCLLILWPFSFLPEHSLFWNLPTLLFQEGHLLISALTRRCLVYAPSMGLPWAILRLRKPSLTGTSC